MSESDQDVYDEGFSDGFDEGMKAGATFPWVAIIIGAAIIAAVTFNLGRASGVC